ncbi:cytidine deaminase-like protein [Leucogyrophana mollusca]|uniref:Cytidine deaminase-like protein n=1 Tax=Leucogyrophana mollusca TaxID=85980 RepID=A0ACB8BB62_9AGAM|nr:cytidine deaminase-like protein [Leucogyrophana mollusca]
MSASSTPSQEHKRYIERALEEARRCEPVPTAFCVGCVLVARYPGAAPVVLACGYSRELPGNTHAEANALSKAHALTASQLQALFPSISPPPTLGAIFAHTDVYTTLEPCSVRTSGLAPCADALIDSKIRRCIIGVGEPDDFVKCVGAQKLQNADIEVVWFKGLEEECLTAARRGHE